tara:strand:- start:2154 stop:2354 length:201 start_codon:yes stop_codon:yes gene_type:complete
MKLELIREYKVNDKTIELMFEIDGEFIEEFEKETGEIFSEESFDNYLNQKLQILEREEDWTENEED